MKSHMAYHWVCRDYLLRNGRPVPETGETLVHDEEAEGSIALCSRGLHASRMALHALQYAPGPIVCLVTMGDIRREQDDKLVAAERTIIWSYDATEVLDRFSRQVARETYWKDRPEVVQRFLDGETELRCLANGEASFSARHARQILNDHCWSEASHELVLATERAEHASGDLIYAHVNALGMMGGMDWRGVWFEELNRLLERMLSAERLELGRIARGPLGSASQEAH